MEWLGAGLPYVCVHRALGAQCRTLTLSSQYVLAHGPVSAEAPYF